MPASPILAKKHLVLIITGSIAAYKSLDLIRRAREAGWSVTPVLTKGAQEFITPMAAAALAESPAYTDLFSLKDEAKMGHIRLAREADAVLVAPASADVLARMAAGMADDLATTLLLATHAPVLVAPAMNWAMWEHAATKRNLAQLKADGIRIIEPAVGEMACGETGTGKLASVEEMLAALEKLPSGKAANDVKSLSGMHVVVTAGPTQEPIDPVRFISNHSSGKQGYAIAESLAASGAKVTLISGPTALPQPTTANIAFVSVRTAHEMLEAVEAALPAEIYIGVAAVADWRMDKVQDKKMKKRLDGSVPVIKLVPNPDILAIVSTHHTQRPALVIGFAAETHALESYASGKLQAKGCDWLVATNAAEGRVFGADITDVTLMKAGKKEPLLEKLGTLPKPALAARLTQDIAAWWAGQPKKADSKNSSKNTAPKRKSA